MPKYVYASPDSDCFCSDTAPCEEDDDKCKKYRLYDPDSLGFYDMVELLREFLKNYPDDVFPRHADSKRDVGVIFADMLKDAVEFLDQHPEGQAERPFSAQNHAPEAESALRHTRPQRKQGKR